MKSLSLLLLMLTSVFLLVKAQTVGEVAVDSAYVEAYYEIYPVSGATIDASDYSASSSVPEDELTHYNFKKGNPVFVVVNVQHSIPNDSLLAERELHELQKNFKHLNAEFLTVHDNAVLKFGNRDLYEIRLDQYNSEYQSVIFWNGKADSDVFQLESIIQSSEAYSPQLSVDKTSSYIEEFSRKKEELSKYKNETINQNSRAVSQKYISHLFLSEIYYLKNEENFFPVNFKGVKKITVKSNYKKFKNPISEAEFDQDGNPVFLILQSDDSDGKKINIQFSYISGALKKMVSSFSDEEGTYRNEEEFYYQAGNMYERFNEHGYSKHYINENGFLLSNNYFFDDYRYFIMEDGWTFKEKKLSYTDFGNLNDRDYTINSLENFFPIKVKIRGDSYPDIVKISQNEYRGSEQKILTDDNRRIVKVIMENLEMDGEPKPMDLVFEYFYEYY